MITNPMPRRYPNIFLRRTWRSYGYDIVSLVVIYWIDWDIDIATKLQEEMDNELQNDV